MASPRRIGTEHSKTRTALLDAAEHLMVEDGYAAATSRRVAERAGLKPGLVHYYFRTMDDLFIALMRRRVDESLEQQAKALAAPQPLWALWEFHRDTRNTRLAMELSALANHRKALGTELATYASRARTLESDVLSSRMEQYGLDNDPSTAVTLTMVMSGIAHLLVRQQAFGISAGHAETIALVERYLTQFEGERRPES